MPSLECTGAVLNSCLSARDLDTACQVCLISVTVQTAINIGV